MLILNRLLLREIKLFLNEKLIRTADLFFIFDRERKGRKRKSLNILRMRDIKKIMKMRSFVNDTPPRVFMANEKKGSFINWKINLVDECRRKRMSYCL